MFSAAIFLVITWATIALGFFIVVGTTVSAVEMAFLGGVVAFICSLLFGNKKDTYKP